MFQLPVRISRAICVLFLFISTISSAFSQGGSVASLTSREGRSLTYSPARLEPVGAAEAATIIAQFVAAETKVREALNQHMFRRNVVLQTIGSNGEVVGEYIRNSEFLFDDRGQRIERVLFHPASTIREMRITKQDIQDLAGSQLLGIDIVEASKYRLTYAGGEAVDSRLLLAIDVTPLTEPNPKRMSERFFVGRVWVDPTTFQIVKISGIVQPQGKQRFPRFVTWREPIKSALAFPTRTEADDVLHFQKRDVHYRIKVSYFDYKLFGSTVNITETDEPLHDINEALPKTKEAPPKTNEGEPKNNDVSPRLKEAAPEISENPFNRSPSSTLMPRKKSEICTTNRNAPPVGDYHWASDTEVKVYFVRTMFTSEQSAVLLEAMKTWTMAEQEVGSGVRFIYGGETETRMSCRGCLTVTRRNLKARDKRIYAVFHPMKYEEGRLLVSAWIDFDFGIKDPKALQGFMAHELAHGLGLWDCNNCKKNRSLMSSFPDVNKNNGLIAPSTCDLATMKDVYREERQIAEAMPRGDQRAEAVQADSGPSLSPLGRERASFSGQDVQRATNREPVTPESHGYNRTEEVQAESGFDLPPFRLSKASFSLLKLGHPMVGRAGASKFSSDQLTETFWTESIFPQTPSGLDKPGFSAFDLHTRQLDSSLFFWRSIY
jgi:hypothetical protein